MTIVACKQEKKENLVGGPKAKVQQDEKKYPEAIAAVFDAHGGLDTWHKMNSLSYEIVKPTATEKQTIDLKSRNDLIETDNYAIGFDGEKSWLREREEGVYKGNARFYHNLMFYFYAMPFVLADDGISFEETEPFLYEGKTYPGLKVSYQANIGDSPNDNYYVYFDADSNRMQWLGYTVTFGKDEANTNIKYINYNDWGNHGGLLLPNSITWHKVEDAKVLGPAQTYSFDSINLSEDKLDPVIFVKPDGAVVPEQ